MQPSEDAIEATASAAVTLATRTGLPPIAAAIVAVLHAIEHERWPASMLEDLVAHAYDLDRSTIVDQLGDLERWGLVIRTDAGVALDPVVRRALATELPDPGALGAWTRTTGADRQPGLGALERLVVVPGSLTVVCGGNGPRRRAAIHAAAGPSCELASLRIGDPPTIYPIVGFARIAWLRGALLAISGPDELDWIDQVIAIPARIAIELDAVHAGEALARARRVRDAIAWSLPSQRMPESLGSRAIPPGLEPLVSTTWNGARVGGSIPKLAALRGSPAAVRAASHAVAASLGTVLGTANARDGATLVHVRDALAKDQVVLVEGASQLDEIEARALSALVASSAGLVLVAADGVPAALHVDTTLDVGAIA